MTPKALRKKSWPAMTKAKVPGEPKTEPDDFCVVSVRLRDDDERLWQETCFFIGTRGQLAKLIPNPPPGARFYQGDKARVCIKRAVTRAQEGYEP